MSSEDAMPGIPQEWDSYLCRVNDQLSSIYVNLGLSLIAPVAGTPKLAWLWIRLNQPRDDGLSSDEEFDLLCRLEDQLVDALGRTGAGIYAGRITGRGRREFYFYLSQEADLRGTFDPVLANYPDHAFQIGEKADADWSHYVSVLLPGTHGLEQILSAKSKE